MGQLIIKNAKIQLVTASCAKQLSEDIKFMAKVIKN